MCHCIEKVFQLAVSTFSKATSQDLAKKNLELLVTQTNKLKREDVGLENCSVFQSSPSNNSKKRAEPKSSPVTYIPVAENKHISMGIFVIREGQNIPLHDHPHMHGVIKCLEGKLKITSFTKVENSSTPDRFRRSPNLLEKLRYGELFLAEQDSVVHVTPESTCCILSPDKANIHKIESVGGPAAFLDILAPPYNIEPDPYADDQQERDCHYFRVLSEPTDNSPSHKWLIMCDPPASFYCDTETYSGPDINDVNKSDGVDIMDQILASLVTSNLADSLNDVAMPGIPGTVGVGEELSGEINDVMQALESVASTPEPIKPPEPVVNLDQRLEKCAERQHYLESRYRNLQMRINRLRAQKLSCNARDVLGSVVASCDKRRARMNGDIPTSTATVVKTEPTDVKVDVVGDGPTAPPPEEAIKKIRVKKYNKARTDEVLGQIHSQLRHVQHYVDPDATESSSGGESGDEMDKWPAGAELYAPLHERAKYRWHARRAQIASQWVWLQAQVSDLEYKIRQHTDLYRAQRMGKGSVQLGEDTVSWPQHAKVPVLPGTSDAAGVPLSCPVPTRVYGQSSAVDSSDNNTDDESSMTCCRVRPVKRVRRRKLVDTFGLHHHVARAAKLSSVSCQCLRPGQWCVLCLGRRSHTLSVSGGDKRARQENVALLDHSYHTVLSDSRADTKLSLVLMESLANKRWLVRHTTMANGPIQPGQPGHLTKLLNINDRDKKEKKDKLDLGLKRKYIKRKDKDGKIIKKRRKLDSERESRPESPLEMLSGPVVSDLNIKAVRDGVERIRDKMVKKRKSSYDIDHIVIPMSMAATTRVEKIKYKEILVPSWREVNKEDSTEAETVEPKVEKKEETELKDEVTASEPVDAVLDDDFEDISDLAYKLMHVKAEEEERARWATPLGRVHGGQRGHNQVGRGRARRLDSCRTEASSGANTPNPLSPEAIEDIVVATRPSSPQHDAPETPDVSSPPPMDTPPSSMTSPTALMPTPLSSVPASVRGRRRTSSQTKSRDRNLSEASQHSQESSRSTSPWTEVEERWSQPWERRVFPLSEDELKDLEAEEKMMLRDRRVSGHGDSTRETRGMSQAGHVSTVSTPVHVQPDTVSMESSRATSRSVEVRLVKLKSDDGHYRSSSVCEETEPETVERDTTEDADRDSADPDWEENEEEETREGDDDPEYDPETPDKNKKNS